MEARPQQWTVRSLLDWARGWLERRGIDSPRLDAELLLARALGCDRLRLYIDADKPLRPDELAGFKALLKRREQREPVAYILGMKEFYGRSFRVDRRAFIPRPETELLVEAALQGLPKDAGATLLDLCAGSGAVGVSMAAERPCAQVDLVELSPDAAEVARTNADTLAPGRTRIHIGDLFAPLAAAGLGPAPRYDAIASNPPYVAAGDRTRLAPEIVEHEPHQALFAGVDGLAVIRRLVAEAPRWLKPGAVLALELDPSEGEEVARLCAAAGLTGARVHKDYAGLDRIVTARAP